MLKMLSRAMFVFLCLTVPLTAVSDDTEIYGTTSVSVNPNVLIILDNSGSMKTQDVTVAYDPDETYSGSYTSNSVYYYKCTTTTGKRPTTTCSWTLLTTSASSLQCSDVISDLQTQGYSGNTLNTSNFSCSGSPSTTSIELGNYLNYTSNTSYQKMYRWQAATNALSYLLENTADKNFGLMMFNSSYTMNNGAYVTGGYIKYPCGTANTTINTYVEGMTATDFNTWTPLAETLAEAGLYFAGMPSWYNTGVTYTSPITEVCQKNYIILITDGFSTHDDDPRLYKTVYMNSKVIGDYDGDEEDFKSTGTPVLTSDGDHGTYFLNDVASFLYNEDVMALLGTGTSFVKQNITTFTIGLKTDNDLLESTAAYGGGEYYTTSTASGLSQALAAIDNAINETNAVFLAPSIPVNSTTKTSRGDWVYLSIFQPQSGSQWLGNLKKFALGSNGEIYGKASGAATNLISDADTSVSVVDEYGTIMDNACSFWTVYCSDGGSTTQGGVGENLLLRSDDRNIYYYTGTDKNLTASSNAFTTSNTALPVSNTTITNITTFDSNENWKLGAIIHSSPAVVPYSTTDSVIYVGANDGMLHCFDDTTGSELWAFIPPDLASNLPLISSSNLVYYVDASPVIAYGKSLITGTQLFEPLYMIFGERRGGYYYTVIDISSYLSPQWKYQVGPSILYTATGETLGQSWSTPVVCVLSSGTVTEDGVTTPVTAGLTDAFLIAGGYDTNQDLASPSATDLAGRAVFAVSTETGGLTAPYNGSDLFRATHSTLSSMQHCIVDVSASSTYTMPSGSAIGTDVTTRIYAGDLNGSVFVFADDLYTKTSGSATLLTKIPDGTFALRNRLFSVSGKKIFYAPAVSLISGTLSEWVVFGTGDREKPLTTTVQNGIYAVRNTWTNTTPYTETDLTDLSLDLIQVGTTDEKTSTVRALASSKGWYIHFPDAGEKLSSPIIITNGQLYFTTYVPSASSTTASTDPCEGVGATGVSYLWSIELETGIPVDDSKTSEIETGVDARRTQVAVMAQPTLSGNLISTPAAVTVPTLANSNYFFWRQH